MTELIVQQGLTIPPNVKTIIVSLPMMNGFYDLVTLAQGLDYQRTDAIGAIAIHAILDGSEALEITGSKTDNIDSEFSDRGVYVHGPFSVKIDPETLVFKVNALKQVPGLVLRVAVSSWRKDVTLGVTR